MKHRRANQTQFALLGFLESGPMSGYDLKQRIGHSVAHFWREGWGQIYPTLKRLEHGKLVTRTTIAQNGKPDRQVYRITEAGLLHLQRWRCSPVSLEVPRNELLLKLFFGRPSEARTSLDQVQAYRGELERLQSAYQAIEAQLRQSQEQPHSQLRFWQMTLSYGRHRVVALIAWCDETLETLHEMERANSKIEDKMEV
jgi:DNA-binding PadR family transcriptional regulator